MYRITLSDGYQIDDLELNGNNFIAQNEIRDDVFEGKLSTVILFNKETQTEKAFTDMVLVSNLVRDGKSWFILAEKTEEQKERERIENTFTDLQMALIEVYEMMTGGKDNG